MDIPKFYDLDDEIRKLTESVTSFPAVRTAIDEEYSEKQTVLLDRIDQLRRKINELNDERRIKHVKAKQKYDEDFDKLAALKKQKKEEELSSALNETVDLIKEIVENFAAWQSAREYQVEDVVQIVHQYLIGSNGVMNANAMALGKTFETLVALYIIIELHVRKTGKKPKILWLTKKTIVETGGTFKEAKRWFPELKIVPIKGAQNKVGRDLAFEFAESGGICILTNYENVKSDAARNIEWDILVMDEVHKLKGGANSSGPTAIWEAVKDLKVGFQMMLTGTPLVNKIEEIWSYLHLFDPVAFPDAKKFARQFNAFRDLSGKLKFDVHSERMLKDILRGRLIRRTEEEVGRTPAQSRAGRTIQADEGAVLHLVGQAGG
jgi:SNF2 family DNA or RNA helicase